MQGHTYQTLSYETAINAKFSELVSLKRIYVKYKNAILSHTDCSFRTYWIRHMGIYFPRTFITTARHVVNVEPIKYLGNYMIICLILSCAKEAMYM